MSTWRNVPKYKVKATSRETRSGNIESNWLIMSWLGENLKSFTSEGRWLFPIVHLKRVYGLFSALRFSVKLLLHNSKQIDRTMDSSKNKEAMKKEICIKHLTWAYWHQWFNEQTFFNNLRIFELGWPNRVFVSQGHGDCGCRTVKNYSPCDALALEWEIKCSGRPLHLIVEFYLSVFWYEPFMQVFFEESLTSPNQHSTWCHSSLVASFLAGCTARFLSGLLLF